MGGTQSGPQFSLSACVSVAPLLGITSVNDPNFGGNNLSGRTGPSLIIKQTQRFCTFIQHLKMTFVKIISHAMDSGPGR